MRGIDGAGPPGGLRGFGQFEFWPRTPPNVQLGTTGADILAADPSHDGLVGLAGDDSLTGSSGADGVFGGLGADTIAGVDGDDRLDGGPGADSVSGGAGADTISGGGGDTVSGGAGADAFFVRHAHGPDAVAAMTVLDFTAGEDSLHFGPPAATAANFTTATAADFAAAQTAAQSLMAGDAVSYVAVQVGADVVVFSEGRHDGEADSAVILAGKTLSAISYADIV